MADGISREDVRPSQIKYQLLNAQLALGKEWDSAEDAPDAVNDALEHIQTAMQLFDEPETPLSDARPDEAEFPDPLADSVWEAYVAIPEFDSGRFGQAHFSEKEQAAEYVRWLIQDHTGISVDKAEFRKEGDRVWKARANGVTGFVVNPIIHDDAEAVIPE